MKLEQNQMEVKFKTRLSEDSPEKVETTMIVTFDDENATREFAKRGVVIAAQNIFRTAGEIPAQYECKVSELAKRERGGFTMKATPENAAKLLSKLSDADATVMLQSLGMDKSAIARYLASRPKSAPAVVPNVAPTPKSQPSPRRK